MNLLLIAIGGARIGGAGFVFQPQVLPIVIEIVDASERVEAFLPRLEAMVGTA